MTTKFIRLTEAYSDGTDCALLLNPDYIMSIKKGKTDTLINMAAEKIHIDKPKERVFFFVKETVDEVWKMIE